MNDLKELFLQLKFAIFLSKTVQNHEFSMVEKQIILRRFAQCKDLNEIQGNNHISIQEYESALENICEQLGIFDISEDIENASKEEFLRSALLVDFFEFSKDHVEVPSYNLDRACSIAHITEDIHFVRGEVQAYKLIQSLLCELKTEQTLQESIKCLSDSILEFDLNYDPIEQATFSSFLNCLPGLVTRLAATSRHTDKEIVNLLIHEIVTRLTQPIIIADLNQLDVLPVICFIGRYSTLFGFANTYTIEEILAQSYQALVNASRIRKNADNFIASLRLQAYSTIQELLASESLTCTLSSRNLRKLASRLERTIETDLKKAWNTLEQSTSSSIQPEQMCLLLDTVKLIKEYLRLSMQPRQLREEQARLTRILELSAKNGLLSFWISQIDCRMVEELQPLCKRRSRFGDRTDPRLNYTLEQGANQLSAILKEKTKLPFRLQSLLAACLSGLCIVAISYLFKSESASHDLTWSSILPSYPKIDIIDLPLSQLKQRGHTSTPIQGLSTVSSSRHFPPESTTQQGIATWYGDEYRNQVTASGERFDPNLLTASHSSLPFQTKVRVRNLLSNREVIVRINDRLPKTDRQIINLSESAALNLGIVKTGIARVQIETISQW